jgi:hypothetical protein
MMRPRAEEAEVSAPDGGQPGPAAPDAPQAGVAQPAAATPAAAEAGEAASAEPVAPAEPADGQPAVQAGGQNPIQALMKLSQRFRKPAGKTRKDKSADKKPDPDPSA